MSEYPEEMEFGVKDTGLRMSVVDENLSQHALCCNSIQNCILLFMKCTSNYNGPESTYNRQHTVVCDFGEVSVDMSRCHCCLISTHTHQDRTPLLFSGATVEHMMDTYCAAYLLNDSYVCCTLS